MEQRGPFGRIFVSHSHVDQEICKCIEKLATKTLGSAVHIARSSRPGEVEAGRNWRDWIYDQLKQSDFCLVVLTPASIQSDWVLCETGIFTAISHSRAPDPSISLDPIIPLSFLATDEDIPGPLQSHKVLRGMNHAEVRETCRSLLQMYRDKSDERLVAKQVADEGLLNLDQNVADYIAQVERARLETPLDRSDELVQEWLARFTELKSKERLEEARNLRRMAQIAFVGPSESRSHRELLDFRLHRRFGDVFYQMGEFTEAEHEYRQALKRAPRDVYLLRRLHQVVLDNKIDPERGVKAGKILEDIYRLDPDGIRQSAELSGAFARSKAENGHFAEAAQAFKDYIGYEHSGYALIAAAIYSMKAFGLTDEVQKQFQKSLDVVRNTTEQKDFWSTATELNALLALGRIDEAKHNMSRLSQYGNSEPEWNSATKYFDDILEQRKKIDRRRSVQNFDWKLYREKGSWLGWPRRHA
jgi:tetratricopeptide (TPR) repeat protein